MQLIAAVSDAGRRPEPRERDRCRAGEGIARMRAGQEESRHQFG